MAAPWSKVNLILMGFGGRGKISVEFIKFCEVSWDCLSGVEITMNYNCIK